MFFGFRATISKGSHTSLVFLFWVPGITSVPLCIEAQVSTTRSLDGATFDVDLCQPAAVPTDQDSQHSSRTERKQAKACDRLKAKIY